MALEFYNSLGKQVEQFHPRDEGKVRLYNCGPTVYKRQHLGNWRRYLFADFLRRTLEHNGYEVREITNITDVGHLTRDDIDSGEDKLERAAREEKTSPQAIAEVQIKLFKRDAKTLNIKPAHLYPRASQHVPQMIALIQELLAKGHAYQAADGIYFSVESFPDYGKLSGNRLADLKQGARVEVRSEKKHPADFALWKFDAQHLQQWDSPWGKGFPGWHIECSAMSREYLGNDIDIHTGGEDNRFPHHENEIAQSEAASGQRFVHYWLHNAHLKLQGQKIAKRGGEQLTMDDLKRHDVSPLAFRLFVFGAHYRHPLEFSWDAVQEAQAHLAALAKLLRRLGAKRLPGQRDTTASEAFDAALADDLNTPEAWAVVLGYIKKANAALDGAASPEITGHIQATLEYFDEVLGVVEPLWQEALAVAAPAAVTELAEQRDSARQQGDFKLADELRARIEKSGFTVEDTASGPRLVKKT